MKRTIAVLALLLLATAGHAFAATPAPIPVRVVVVTTFEPGADAGDRPGEFQFWVERLPLPQTILFPQAYRHLRYNPTNGVLASPTNATLTSPWGILAPSATITNRQASLVFMAVDFTITTLFLLFSVFLQLMITRGEQRGGRRGGG